MLPAGLPAPEAIKSFGQNEHAYHPDMWELEYMTYRYLGRVADDELNDRYGQIVRNMQSLVRPEWDRVPIKSFHSSWYWYRKEHQTRLEFALRGQAAPHAFPATADLDLSAPIIPRFPNGTEVIFRYGKREFMRDLVQQGRVRLSPAQSYDSAENNAARKDEELAKHAFMPGQYVTVTKMDGAQFPITGNIRRTVNGPSYHLVCFSCSWNKELFDDFEADTCVAITNPEEFFRRLQIAGQTVFPHWYFMHCPVGYFDPYEQGRNELFDPALSKDFRFAYQREYRLFWSQLDAQPIDGHQFVNIGPAGDIMAMYDADGSLIE